jgi:hypothetical protein
MDKMQAWLLPPWPYVKDFASISWSPAEDALVYEHGETFILREPLADFIDGFSQERDLVHFGYLLHLLDIFLKEKMHRPKVCNQLRRLMKQPGVSFRNAGRLAAFVTPKVKPSAEPKSLASELYYYLRNPLHRIFDSSPFSSHTDVTATVPLQQLYDAPELTPLELENSVCDKLSKLTEADLKHWLRIGEAPEKVELVLPVLQSAAWEERLLANERLRGVAPFLAPLMSALTLPPRRLVSNDLPLGGYTDVTNRGRIDALLPTQFALDPDDFIRRFAEQELLYFRREDPVSLPEADVLIVLDQGIRTWGAARLRLTAAALAVAANAQSHGRRVYLATSNRHRELQELSDLNAVQLEAMLERSDLTAHPSQALSMLAQHTKVQTLDIVLLSHPRNLLERSVMVANQLFHDECRLFALTVDEASSATWGEIKHGELTKMQRFHIEPAATRPSRYALPPVGQLDWTGPIERYASPFQVPTRNRIVDVDFDSNDRWLFVLDSMSRVTAYDLQTPGHRYLTLPRLNEKGEYLSLDGLVGIPHGFVAHWKGDDVVEITQFNMEERQAQTTRAIEMKPVSLSTAEMFSSHPSNTPFPQLKELTQNYFIRNGQKLILTDRYMRGLILYDVARNEARRLHRDAESLRLLEDSAELCRRPDHWSLDPLSIDPKTGNLRKGYKDIQLCCPVSNGKPTLKDCTLIEAQQGGDVLCVLALRRGNTRQTLYAYQKPDYRCIGEWVDVTYFKLSASGRYMATRMHPFCVQVIDLQQNNNLVLRTRSSNRVRVRDMVAGPGWLHVQYSGRQSSYLIDWRTDTLQCTYRGNCPGWGGDEARHATAVEIITSRNPDNKVMRRHVTLAHRFEADELGHLWIHDLDGKLRCVFLIDQTDLAGWMPDGTTFGPVRLVGHDSPSDALNRFAATLRQSRRST